MHLGLARSPRSLAPASSVRRLNFASQETTLEHLLEGKKQYLVPLYQPPGTAAIVPRRPHRRSGRLRRGTGRTGVVPRPDSSRHKQCFVIKDKLLRNL